jgi:hypothetical protein
MQTSSPIAIVPTSAPTSYVPTSAPISFVPTSAPIATDPNLGIWASVLTSYINNITLSNQTITVNGPSPECKALAWLIYNDTTFNTTDAISEYEQIAISNFFHILQHYPLLVMWFQQTDTAKWDNGDNWLVTPNECYWFGLTCESRDVYFVDRDGYFANGGLQNAITQISFMLQSSYVGTIPVDIGLLTNLEHFEIKHTVGDVKGVRFLFGSLPDSIGQWTSLTCFDVSALTNGLP